MVCDIEKAMTYRTVQIDAIAAALERTTEAIQEMKKAQLPPSAPYVLDVEASLCRAQAALLAIWKGIESPARRLKCG